MKNTPQDSMTLFYVMKYRGGGGYPLDRACFTSSVAECGSLGMNGIFGHNIGGDGTFQHYLRGDDASMISGCTPYCDTGYKMIAGKSYIVTMQRDYGVSIITYVNGDSSYSANSTKTDTLTGLTRLPFKIGAHDYGNTETLDMEMSEIIFFSGAMKKRDRKEIEKYLSKKYNIPLTS